MVYYVLVEHDRNFPQRNDQEIKRFFVSLSDGNSKIAYRSVEQSCDYSKP